MKNRAILLVTLLFSASVLRGQEQASPAPAPTPVQSEQTAPTLTPSAPAALPTGEVQIKDAAPMPTASKGSRDSAGHETLSVDFPDEDIRTILRNVADLFELNLVIPEQLQGKTSVKLRDVSWRQIFQVVLAPANYTYMEDGNIIKIVSMESLQQEPTDTVVFILNYARAAEILPTVASLVDAAAGGKIVVDSRSNALVVTERPSRLTRVRPIIESLDRATDQVMIESKFIEVTDSDVRNLGAKWDGMKNFKASASGVGSTMSDLRGRDASTAAFSNLEGIAHSAKFSAASTAVFSASDFAVVLSALNELSNTRIVSNPTIVTLNNTEASINVGEEYPVPNYTYNAERGAFEIQGFTYKKIGVILKVTPQVNSRGFVKLTLEPEVTQRTGEANFNGALIPIIASRRAQTQVSLKDGFTMGLGGLIKKQTIDGVTKIPLLGDIPLIGTAFKHKNKDTTTTNLLIFITAKIVNTDGASVQQVFDSQQLNEATIIQGDLPGRRDLDRQIPVAAPKVEPKA